MVSRIAVGAVLLCVLLLATGATGAVDRSLDIQGGTDLPTQTYDTKWGEYDIDSVARVDVGDTITVDSIVPDGEYHEIRVVNSDEKQVRYDAGRGNSTYDVDLGTLEYGTYAVALANGTDTAYDVEPLLIRGYEVSVDAPDSTNADSIDVSVSLSAAVSNPESPSEVTVTMGNDSTTVTATTSSTGSRSYEATLSTGAFAPGEYAVYATVEGSDSAFGHDERIGVSDTSTVTLTGETTSTPTSTPEPTTASGGSDGTDGTDEAGQPGSPDGTEPSEPTTEATTTTPPTATETPTTTPREADEPTTSTAEPTDEGSTPDGGDATTDVPSTPATTERPRSTATATATSGSQDGTNGDGDGSGSGATTATTAPLWSTLGYLGALLVVGTVVAVARAGER